MRQPMRQLHAAAGHPRVVLAAHLQRLIGGNRLPRLVDPPLAGEHQPGHDQCLRARPRLGQAAIDQQLVGPAPAQRDAFAKRRIASPNSRSAVPIVMTVE